MTDDTTNRPIGTYLREWEEGRDWVEHFTRDFRDLDNLADAVPLANSPKAPLVGSVTLSSAVRQIPRSSVQQLPTMSVEVNGTKRSVKAIVCDYLVRRVIFNQDSFGKGVLSSVQIAAESALTHGFQPFFASLTDNSYTYGEVKLNLVHHRDFVIEPGVFDASESSYYYVRTRVTREKLKERIRIAKENPDSLWDVSALEELLETQTDSDNFNNDVSDIRQNPSEMMQNTFDIITRYGTGAFYDIVTFNPNVQRPLRTMKSRSKFGYPRLQNLVIDPAQLTPFGVSRVRMASAPANYANIYLQSTAKMQILNADPPTFEKGEFIGTPALRRGARIRGVDQNSQFELMELSNTTLNQFQEVLRFLDGQVMSVMGVASSDSTTRASSSYVNSTVAKSDEQDKDLSVQQVTAILENSLRQYALTALDLYVSEQMGEAMLTIDDKAKDAINELGESNFVPTPEEPMYTPLVGDDNELKIIWEDFYGGIKSWTVDIDLSMGKDQLDEKKRADLQDMHTVISQTANPNDPNDVALKNTLTKELVETALPDSAAIADNSARGMVPPAPAPEAPIGG